MGKRTGTLVAVAVACTVGVAALAFPGRAGATDFGANDDTAKYTTDGGVAYFHQMTAVGLRRVTFTVRFVPSDPTRIQDEDMLDEIVPNVVAAGLQVAFATYPYPPRELALGLGSPAAFAAWLARLAERYPQVRQYVVMNEPNQPAFFRPQYDGAGLNASAALTGMYLAAAYDALKGVDPTLTVIGVGLSPRGNDNAHAPSNISTSPVRFLAALGRWYRASGRTAPLMDGFGFHPYPNAATDPLSRGYGWPDAGFVNLARIKQAIWDAFAGTPQPTTLTGLKLYLDEVGWQVDTTGEPGYFGTENVPVTDEATQAAIYGDLVRQAACDSDIAELSFFGFYDDGLRSGFQAGLYRADGTARPSAAAVQQAIAETTLTGCTGVPASWSPATTVLGANARGATFDTGGGAVTAGAPLELTVSLGAGEGAIVSAAVVRAGPRPSVLSRLLQGVQHPVATSASAVALPYRTAHLTISLPTGLSPGRYLVTAHFAAESNAGRTSVLHGRAFVVR
jgi:hypothetical protein